MNSGFVATWLARSINPWTHAANTCATAAPWLATKHFYATTTSSSSTSSSQKAAKVDKASVILNATASGATNPLLLDLLKSLLNNYKKQTPDAIKIEELMVAEKIVPNAAAIENDHIAFRTFNDPALGIDSIEQVFVPLGYKKRDYLNFEDKKLNAYWYSPPSEDLPRVFVSEIRVQDLSLAAQSIIHKHIPSNIPSPKKSTMSLEDRVKALKENKMGMSQIAWPKVERKEYKVLAEESEYAAWVLLHGHKINHFTIALQNLPAGYNTCTQFNQWLKDRDFVLNTAGGEVKTSHDGLLMQSATIAARVPYTFNCGTTVPVPYAYVEFAERLPLPEFLNSVFTDKQQHGGRKWARHMLREGFEVDNANLIFESTYMQKKTK
eukprot:CAMPEP_0184699204 /NCGR_PEP_ID=MMETSP0313-20130426/5556_1 /TAXON_ID=2792 /ORGANISM="Porphyridium aerugineum, Strain SAG 1380-2" /LENGTH=379 /DNA_ID=CAMNT_0027158253 /DNA_START=789 /DNA_END=1928 /DNA_ORIENTATION=+